MAILTDISNVNISLETAAVSQAGFGVPLFISDHFWFKERVRLYPSTAAAQEDIPADSDAYKALEAAFKQSPQPEVVMIGRREADDITFTPAAVTKIGQVFSVAVVGTDDVKVTATFTTSTGTETATAVASALATGLAAATGVTIVDNTGSFTLSSTGSMSVGGIKNLTHATTTSEAAADVLQAIEEENNDFYFVATNDHSEAFVLAMAAAVETRERIYFTGTQELGSIATLADPATDTAGKLFEANYFRTASIFHHEADEKFVEMAYICVAAPSTPGKKVWFNNRVAGFGKSAHPTTGKALTFTEKNNLNARNCGFIEPQGGLDIFRRGFVAAGERISTIRNKDFMTARLTENLQTMQINAPVLTFSDFGIAKVESVMRSTLDRMVETEQSPNILQAGNPYELFIPAANEVSFADKAAGVLNIEFVAYLAGAIEVVKVTGKLTYDNLA